MDQLEEILIQIHWVGDFIELILNLDKTLAFSLFQIKSITKYGILIDSTPIKYLGCYLVEREE